VIWLRAIAVWLVIVVVESVHGTARTLWLEPVLGSFRARQLSVFTACILIAVIALLFITWLGASRKGMLLMVGALWVMLTLMFEFGVGRLVLGFSWERLTEDYDISRGGLIGLGLLFMFAAPYLAARMRSNE
jgi:hypothetical protein